MTTIDCLPSKQMLLQIELPAHQVQPSSCQIFIAILRTALTSFSVHSVQERPFSSNYTLQSCILPGCKRVS